MSHVNRRFLLPIPGDYSKIRRYADHPHDETGVQARVSSIEQKTNLPTQVNGLIRVVEEAGAVSFLLPTHEWSGRGPAWLDKLRIIGDTLRTNGVEEILFFSTDRLIRSRDFRSDHPLWCNAQATQWEYEDAIEALGESIQVYTYLHPNATPKEVRKARTEWGQREKKNKGGRPPRTRKGYKRKWMARAIELREMGLTYREVAEELSRLSLRCISHVTIKNWLEET